MANRSATYFPLRSNASSLIAGAGVAAVRRRLMLGLLLHDEIVVEGGYFHASLGPNGGFSTWMGQPLPGREPTWQRPRQRGSALRGTTWWRMRSSAAAEDAPFPMTGQSSTSINWMATFEPFRDELPRDLRKSVIFGHFPDAYEMSRVVGAWDSSARHDKVLLRHWPEQFVRDLYVGGLHRDLAIAAQLGAAMSADPAHAPVIGARIRAGEGRPVAGHLALELVVPKGFTWVDLAELKRGRRLRDYRAVLREVEAAAFAGATSAADLQRALGTEYWRRVSAAAGHQPKLWARAALAGFGLVAGTVGELATAGAPLVGSAGGAAAGFVASEVVGQLTTPRWLAIHSRIYRPR